MKVRIIEVTGVTNAVHYELEVRKWFRWRTVQELKTYMNNGWYEPKKYNNLVAARTDVINHDGTPTKRVVVE